jgi:hypothetical protein
VRAFIGVSVRSCLRAYVLYYVLKKKLSKEKKDFFVVVLV